MASAQKTGEGNASSQSAGSPTATEQAVQLLTSMFQQVQNQLGPARRALEGAALRAVEQHAAIARILRVRGQRAAQLVQIPALSADLVWQQAPFSGAGSDRDVAAPPPKTRKPYSQPRKKTKT